MVQILIVSILVLFCAGYWLQRLAPSLMKPFWRGLALTLSNLHVLPGLRGKAEKLASPGITRTGCGGCKGCDSKGGGCH
ncbi:DUF6587 family protein [Acetobacter sp. DsW_059]|uniref:DUF6587 family protein n=1 Tax=Acetobacter sp. DsW_059 TaxID=1670661 RepID=UPI000A38EBE7|nr:DUF6587 family protein [Acetobacter sp. DsW_059]